MSFAEAVSTCLMQKFMVFSGRAQRSEYWYFFLFNIVLSVLARVLDSALHLSPGFPRPGLIGTTVSSALLLPGLAVAIRRLHDTNRSGWWLLLALIPVLGMIPLMVFMAQKGSPSANRFDPYPMGSALG